MFKFFVADVKSRVKVYFKNKTASFYSGFSLAVLSVFASVYYAFSRPAETGFNAGIFLLILFGGLSYFAISLFDKNNAAALSLGLCEFFGLIVFLRVNYSVILENDFMTGGFTVTPNIANFIAITIILAVISVASNVLAWKKNKSEKGGEKDDAQT